MSREHRFSYDTRCFRCGMRRGYYEEALAMVKEWPEGSEKEKRLNELRSCTT